MPAGKLIGKAAKAAVRGLERVGRRKKVGKNPLTGKMAKLGQTPLNVPSQQKGGVRRPLLAINAAGKVIKKGKRRPGNWFSEEEWLDFPLDDPKQEFMDLQLAKIRRRNTKKKP